MSMYDVSAFKYDHYFDKKLRPPIMNEKTKNLNQKAFYNGGIEEACVHKPMHGSTGVAEYDVVWRCSGSNRFDPYYYLPQSRYSGEFVIITKEDFDSRRLAWSSDHPSQKSKK